jgi:hypothetical protein
MEFGIEMCWFYSPVDLLKTLPKQKALIRKCNLKVTDDYKIWFNE